MSSACNSIHFGVRKEVPPQISCKDEKQTDGIRLTRSKSCGAWIEGWLKEKEPRKVSHLVYIILCLAELFQYLNIYSNCYPQHGRGSSLLLDLTKGTDFTKTKLFRIYQSALAWIDQCHPKCSIQDHSLTIGVVENWSWEAMNNSVGLD